MVPEGADRRAVELADWLVFAMDERGYAMPLKAALRIWNDYWQGIRDGRLHDAAMYLIDNYGM